jgi:hypothetical protein
VASRKQKQAPVKHQRYYISKEVLALWERAMDFVDSRSPEKKAAAIQLAKHCKKFIEDYKAGVSGNDLLVEMMDIVVDLKHFDHVVKSPYLREGFKIRDGRKSGTASMIAKRHTTQLLIEEAARSIRSADPLGRLRKSEIVSEIAKSKGLSRSTVYAAIKKMPKN